MKFKKIFEEAASYRKNYTKQELALKIAEESGEVSKAVNEQSDQEIKSEIGDLVLAAIALYMRYDENIESLKPLIGRKLWRPLDDDNKTNEDST